MEIEAAHRARNLYSDSEAKACPIKIPLLSGLTSEDFTGFKDKFLEMTLNNMATSEAQGDTLGEHPPARAPTQTNV